MKQPQCNTSAECLRELARVMDQFNFVDHFAAISSKYVKENGRQWDYRIFPEFTLPNTWQFAIAEVEGKPVFLGDELYCNDIKIIAAKEDTGFKLNHLSWNPPKPKTVMVEMLVDDAVWMATSQAAFYNARAAQACKKALEQIK